FKINGPKLRGVCGVRGVVGVVAIKKQVTSLVGCDIMFRMAMMLLRRVDGPCGSVRLYQGPSGRLAEVTEVAQGPGGRPKVAVLRYHRARARAVMLDYMAKVEEAVARLVAEDKAK